MNSDPSRVDTLHPALDQALAAFPAELAARAAAALQYLLRERLAGGGKDAWTSSRLTGDGFPVEITFTTADQRLRYTVEPAGPRAAPAERLETAMQAVTDLGPAPISAETAAAFRSLQRPGGLFFGAYVGGRHSPADDQFKLYVETPFEAATDGSLPAEPAGLLGDYPQPRRIDRPVHLRMIAWSPASDQWELYYRVKDLAPHHLAAVLAPAGLAHLADELEGYLRETYGHAFAERLPGESVGVSYTWQAGETAHTATLFFFARTFWGGDARIRREFGRWSTALGWDDREYQRVTAPLAGRRLWKTYHGILGVTLLPTGEPALSIGVRPPETTLKTPAGKR